ncbi:MAG: 5'-nucleotidase C-terminal domain-containing protein, partial [Nocardioides sp.]
AKILAAINTMDADIVSLEEIENSIKLFDPEIDAPTAPDANRDDAISRLVTELNAAWAAAHPDYVGPRWAYVASPRKDAQPTKAEQDAIRNGFIYDPSTVETVGRSRILTNAPAMRNAREPLAQAFKPMGGGRADRFGVIVNHFKSKGGPQSPFTVDGDNVDSGDGAGFYNGDRKRQAAALLAFADEFASDTNIGPMFLTGDFNAYSMEDPVQIITGGGYHDLHADNGETTYFFGGLAGSLDHVFANDEALAMVTGQTVWPINANEPVYYEYSRFNYNATNLYDTSPFRSSDHNPEIIGIETGLPTPDPDLDVVQVLGINDFHGRILATEGGPEAGAASLAGAVKELRAANPDTVFAAAGDLVGASTFESFIANDKPTIDALNEADLEVSAAGNHEFDQGYDDLVNRIMAPYDATANPEGGALWQYIAGNVRFRATEDGHTAGDPALPETWFSELSDGRTVGFVGAVTEDLPALVAAGGISDIVVEDIVESVNANAEDLTSPGGCGELDGCDLVVMLVHEGAASTAYSAVTDGSTFAQIVAGASSEIDAIVSGHTHLAYNHKVPVQQWVTEGRAVTERPVVSAGQYGAKLNRLEFEFLPGTEQLVDVRQTIVNLNDYDADPATQAIVDAAAGFAAAEGNVPLGDIEGPFQRARRTDPTNGGASVENRGGESTLGNLVAEIQRWKTGADIGFMNPGGLRADLLGLDGTPREVTYRQAADVQPFANTLMTMNLTGAQIKTILEQQWQRDADGNIPSRPFLRLGTSDGFTFTYDPTKAEGNRITGMRLNGQQLAAGTTYRVAATSFLASGTGDNFWGFAAAANKQDTGKTDLQAVVDYMAQFATHDALVLPVDYAQHAVGVTFPGSAPAEYEAGDPLEFSVSSLAMTGASDVQDAEVEAFLGATSLGTSPVVNTLQDLPFDEAGTATVSALVPAGVQDGIQDVVLRGLTTGTEVVVPVAFSDGL